jgi:hypothetical protein
MFIYLNFKTFFFEDFLYNFSLVVESGLKVLHVKFKEI